jgi:hypothetical protein
MAAVVAIGAARVVCEWDGRGGGKVVLGLRGAWENVGFIAAFPTVSFDRNGQPTSKICKVRTCSAGAAACYYRVRYTAESVGCAGKGGLSTVCTLMSSWHKWRRCCSHHCLQLARFSPVSWVFYGGG